jgi:hypothetical protein
MKQLLEETTLKQLFGETTWKQLAGTRGCCTSATHHRLNNEVGKQR